MTQTTEPPRQVIAGLGWRALAAVIDTLPIAVIMTVVSLLLQLDLSTTVVIVLSIAGGLLSLGWAVLVWWGYATRGQGPGARVTKIQVLDVATGAPIGWGRYFLRELIWHAVSGTTVVWIILIVMMVSHNHRRGWHDLAAKSVVVKQRVRHQPAAEPQSRASVSPANVVGLPPHLRKGMVEPQPGVPEANPTGPITAVPTGNAAGGWANTATAAVPWDQWGAEAPAPIEHAPLSGQQGQPGYGQPTATETARQTGFPGAPGQGYPGAQPGFAGAQPGAPGQAGFPGAQQQPGFAAQPGGYAQPGSQQPGIQQQPGQGFSGPAGAAAQPGFPPQPQPGFPPQQSGSYGSPAGAWSDSEDDLQHTHLAMHLPGLQRSVNEGWQVRFDDGRVLDITGTVLVGRNPQPRAGEQAETISVGQDSRMVSKTHLVIGIDHRGLYVTDRNSTNGTAIANADGAYEPCAPGDPVRVREGQVVSFGDHYFEVRRRAPDPR